MTPDLDRDGFVVVSGVAPETLTALADAYDCAVRVASAPALSIGSTTTRVGGLDRQSAFAGLARCEPILQAARRTIGGGFRLRTLLARTLHPHMRVQDLHVDFARDEAGFPMVGFILMIDEFREENGATRFVPGSHRASNGVETVAACGPAGSLIIYNGSVLHGHGANMTDRARRSIQGAYVRKDA